MITVNKAELVRAVKLLADVADDKSSMPILENVLVQTQDDKLILCATDYFVSATASLTAEVKEPFEAFVCNASSLKSAVSNLPGEDLTISFVNNGVVFRSGKAKYALRTASGSNYPPLPDYSGKEFTAVPASEIKSLLDKTSFSTCTDEIRKNLNGILLQVDSDKLRTVSTDGMRLSVAEGSPLEVALQDHPGVIVPNKGIKELKKLITNKEVAYLLVDEPVLFVSVTDPDITMGINLIDAEYPPYEQIIPANNVSLLKVKRGVLLDALRRIKFLCDDKTGMTLKPSTTSVNLSVLNQKLGAADEDIEAEYSGNPIEVNLDPELLIPYLTKMKEERVVISMSSPVAPMLLHEEESKKYLGVLMPMRPRESVS